MSYMNLLYRRKADIACDDPAARAALGRTADDWVNRAMAARKKKAEAAAVPLTQGKLNAVRAAFKAGVTPSRIARQFGISQSDVRKALVGDG